MSGVLSEEELGNTIFIYELQQEYAARIHNLRSYDSVSRDVLQRWAFPFTPDTRVLTEPGLPANYSYSFSPENKYRCVGCREKESLIQSRYQVLKGVCM